MSSGGTSCGAVMTSAGYISEDNRALGAVAFFDDDSDFGVGSQDKAGDPKAAAKKATPKAAAAREVEEVSMSLRTRGIPLKASIVFKVSMAWRASSAGLRPSKPLFPRSSW